MCVAEWKPFAQSTSTDLSALDSVENSIAKVKANSAEQRYSAPGNPGYRKVGVSYVWIPVPPGESRATRRIGFRRKRRGYLYSVRRRATRSWRRQIGEPCVMQPNAGRQWPEDVSRSPDYYRDTAPLAARAVLDAPFVVEPTHKKAAWQHACPFHNISQDRAGGCG
jgi:hypothetical protein